MTRKASLFFLFGAWISLTAMIIAGASFLPSNDAKVATPAAVYRALQREELHESNTLPVSGKVIVVDENEKKVSLYQDGANTASYSITALAPSFTLQEVANGSYAVSGKEPQHLSRRSGLWMAHSVVFGENAFIHASPVSLTGISQSGSDGISIELASKDAEEVYNFAEVGVKVIVSGGYSSYLFATSSRYYYGQNKALPELGSKSFVVMDVSSGEVLVEKSPEEKRQAGRLISFASALTAVDTLDQYKKVRIGELILGNEVRQKRVPSGDDELPLGSLMYPLLFDANETAASTFERQLGTKEFASTMGKQIQTIGMTNTTITSQDGLLLATTTAHDLSLLLRHIYNHEHFLLDVSLSSDHAIYASSGKLRYEWENKNPWVLHHASDYRGGLGTLSQGGEGGGMFLFSLPLAEFGEKVIAFVVIDSTNLEGDVEQMKTYIEENYRYGMKREREKEENKKAQGILGHVKDFLSQDIEYDRNL